MKKILVLLLLISGLVKSQVVQPKSTTTFSNVNTVGNLTVTGTSLLSGTANLTSSTTIGSGTVAANTSSLGILRVKQGSSWIDFGNQAGNFSAIWFGQTPNSSNYGFLGDQTTTYLNGASNVYLAIAGTARANLTSSGFKIGAFSSPSATLDVAGTMSVSSTATVGSLTTSGNITTTGSGSLTISPNYNRLGNLYLQTTNTSSLVTGATNGTIAVLSDALFGLEFNTTGATAPADATTYYIPTGQFFNWTTVAGATKMYLPYNCTLKGYTMNWYINGTAPSAESSTLAINIDGVVTDLNTSIVPNAGASNTFTNTSLNTNINAGSWIEGVIKTPTWVTNPGNSYVAITFWFVRRQ